MNDRKARLRALVSNGPLWSALNESLQAVLKDLVTEALTADTDTEAATLFQRARVAHDVIEKLIRKIEIDVQPGE